MQILDQKTAKGTRYTLWILGNKCRETFITLKSYLALFISKYEDIVID